MINVFKQTSTICTTITKQIYTCFQLLIIAKATSMLL